MKYTNKILEAIQKGINLAVDDLDDYTTLEVQKKARIKDNVHAKDLLNFVDLGLPSGTLWYKYNLGVDENKLDTAKDWYGNYYAWSETEPKQTYSIKNSKYAKYLQDSHVWTYTKYLVKWILGNGYIDNYEGETILDSEDDAAIQNDPRNYGWKMPTEALFDELEKYCTVQSIKNYNDVPNLDGILLISKINGKELFFPKTGYKQSSTTMWKDDVKLWTSSISPLRGSPILMSISGSETIIAMPTSRYIGAPVRPILNIKK